MRPKKKYSEKKPTIDKEYLENDNILRQRKKIKVLVSLSSFTITGLDGFIEMAKNPTEINRSTVINDILLRVIWREPQIVEELFPTEKSLIPKAHERWGEKRVRTKDYFLQDTKEDLNGREKEQRVFDDEEFYKFISRKMKIDKKTFERLMELEVRYMRNKGIIDATN